MRDGEWPGEAGGMALLPAAQAQSVVALRGGEPVSRAMFLRDAFALAARLPERRYMFNLCTDRYRFLTGLGAALIRGQVSLLPPSSAPAVLRDLAADYPDSFILDDTLAGPPARDPWGPAPELPLVAASQPALILFTSGSTGQPKPVPKSWGTLIRSADSAGRRLGLGALWRGASLIATVPHQHSYGMESIILLGLRHGLAMDTGCPLYPADIRAALARAPRPRILVTAPVHLRALLAEPEGMPPADLILSATAPLPQALAAQAEAVFGGRLIEIYGCTEAGQVASRRSARTTAWHCLDGVALTQDATGTLARGPAVEGEVPLHDVILPAGPEHFELGGRAADLVDVAGKRASLAHLNQQLLAMPGVRDGVFVTQAAPGAGVARLMALAVAPGLSRAQILRHLRERIDAAFLPRPLVLVEALPRNPLGKLPREALLRLLESGAGP